jgi:hypothetical protein
MAAELITTQEAREDIAEAYAWYESRRAGLGEEFLGCVDACIEAIRRGRRCMLSYMRIIAADWCAAFRTRFSTNIPEKK